MLNLWQSSSSNSIISRPIASSFDANEVCSSRLNFYKSISSKISLPMVYRDSMVKFSSDFPMVILPPRFLVKGTSLELLKILGPPFCSITLIKRYATKSIKTRTPVPAVKAICFPYPTTEIPDPIGPLT